MSPAILQPILAFFIGGLTIASLSLLAEKSPPALRGLVISFPSTLAISFIFLAHEFGTEILATVLPGVFYALLGSFLFAITFVVISQYFIDKTPALKWPIAVTLLCASLVWLVVAYLSSTLPRQIEFALPVYLFFTVAIQFALWRYAQSRPSPIIIHKTSPLEFFSRIFFAGTVIASAVVLSKVLNPFWGALIGGTYPASFGSQLMIFQGKYPASQLPTTIKTVPLGVTSVAFYAISVTFLYPQLGIPLGTLLAMTGSLCFSLALAKAIRHLSRNA